MWWWWWRRRFPLVLLSVELSLLLLSSETSPCPATCTCRRSPREAVPQDDRYFLAIECETGFGNSSSDDRPLDNRTRSLRLSRLDDEGLSNLLRVLAENDLPEMNAFSISRSSSNGSIADLSEVTRLLAERLEHLSLTGDALGKSAITPDLSANVNLITLDLSGNELESLPAYRLDNLTVLNLSGNLIRECRRGFANYSRLESLDLSRNELEFLGGDDDTFSALGSLRFLNLSSNRLTALNGQTFVALTRLQQLDVSWNRLRSLAPGGLPLPSLARLVLAGNSQLGRFPGIFLVGIGQRLHTVDVSMTGLKRVPATVTRSIRTLKLIGNVIDAVTCGELDAYPLLRHLDLTSNDLGSIEEDALGRLESLTVLRLADNKLASVPKSLPEQLTVLHLERNAIASIARDDFNGLLKLEVLLLNDNKITRLDETAFGDLRSLVTLDLSRNPIKALGAGSLAGPLALQILRLSDLDVTASAKDTSFPLSAPERLASLDLSRSAGLVRQLLADTAALAASRELQELDISGADLAFIRPDLLHFLPELRIMHVKDNRLNCTDLQWLAKWMRRQNRAEHRYVTCASPPALRGTPLLDLQYNEINNDEERERNLLESERPTSNIIKATNGVQKLRPEAMVSVITTAQQRSAGNKGANATAVDGGPPSRYKGPTRAVNKASTSLNLPPNERIFNDTFGLTERDKSGSAIQERVTDANMTENMLQWNASTATTSSMYQRNNNNNNNNNEDRLLLHPGMLILLVGLLCGAVTLITVAARFNHRKRSREIREEPERIPVASISSIAELW